MIDAAEAPLLRGDGWSLSRLAARYGVSRQGMHGWLKRREIPAPAVLTETAYRPDNPADRRRSAVRIERLVELRRAGLTYRAIGRAVGLAESTVATRLAMAEGKRTFTNC